jgi:two-component system, chemotaxis family, CheB/CheR fusion protein
MAGSLRGPLSPPPIEDAADMSAARKQSKAMASKTTADAGRISTRRSTQGSTKAPATAATPSFPIVGIGASAGGLAAFEAFFSGMPTDIDPGMAFILVQHLAPDHKSILTDLVQRYTRMQVIEVEDGMVVRPNCTYIIPPGRDMVFLGGVLQLLEPTAPRGRRMPIDFFFRSLAQDQRERAIGIVLSGTGSDGTLGIRAIKGDGGMVMVQTPASTEHDGMPRNALATGLVDYELPPAEMPAQIIAFASQALGKPRRPDPVPVPMIENALRKVFILVRAQTGHDFSQYKPGTVKRRIERRMAIHQIESVEQYVRYLQQTPTEVEALASDMLIGVTSFFRDQDAFKAIAERVIPELCAGKAPHGVIRVWSAGCSTGEEAYSLAILLAEHQEKLKQDIKVQVFATDIDKKSIATARAGTYPASIATDITPERLARFFSIEPDGSYYRVHKNIRDMLVFSEQNVFKDPPFSRLDLISCRNLLIYFDSALQKRIIPLFHYALNPGGFLFLGTSETVGSFADLFTAIDRKVKLYCSTEGRHHPTPGRFPPPLAAVGLPISPVARMPVGPARPSLRALTEKALLQHAAPAAALVNVCGDILYLHGRTGAYLEPAPGETGVSNILQMAREGLRRDLVAALRRAAASGEAVRCPGLRVKSNGDVTAVDLTVHALPVDPAAGGAPSGVPETSVAPLFLVVLDPIAIPATARTAADADAGAEAGTEAVAGEEAQALLSSLRLELRAKEEFLQATSEEMETTNQELRSTNEEMQSVNEELQSTNEELETSKEELQSVNEELSTVNTELQANVVDLTRANNDISNLLAGTGIATVFVDHRLRILRFTPTATRIINLIQGDVGRPIDHIVSNLVGYDRLAADTQSVLDTLEPRELEVRTKAGVWHSMRILPYRTLENVIEGAVITFVNISVAKEAQEALSDACLRATVAFVAVVREPLLVLAADLRIVSANDAFYRTFQLAPAGSSGQSLFDLDHRRWDVPALRKLLLETLPRESVVHDYVITREVAAIGLRTLRLDACTVSETGQPTFTLLAIEDITEV